ncbi:MAG: hypothetical protein J1F17_04025 [Oscillospiraceae bacterium]|nr:hypothetical protein [Oscillospiraceae bacterium]
MKKLFSLMLTVVMAAVMVLFSVAGVSAAEKLSINNKVNAEVGDTVKFSLFASDVPQKVEDVQLEIYYDSEFLEVVEDEIDYIQGGSPVYNINISDRVLFNSANGISGWDMKKRTLLFEVGFKVLKSGETDHTYFIQCMDYLHNSQTVDKYVITCDYSVNGNVEKKKDVPVVEPEGMGGVFVNYKNGKGPLNGGDQVVGGNEYQGASVNNQNLSPGNQNNIGSEVNLDDGNSSTTKETTIIKTNSSGVAVTTPDGEDATWSESNDFWRNAGIIALSAAIVLVIIIMVIISKKKKEED